MNEDLFFLKDICDRISQIEIYTQGGKSEFLESRLIQDNPNNQKENRFNPSRHKIIMKLQQSLQDKREAIIAIAAKHGAFNVRIFGSVARGEEREDSDIDFLIDYDLSQITPWFPGGLLMDLEELLECKVDIVTERGVSPLIRERVLQEAKPL